MKPRRDITLGEMQDECKKYWNNGNLGSCGKCQYMEVCCHYEDYAPARLNLADPPRFNEQQMAFWRGWYEIGCKSISVGYNGNFIFDMNENGVVVIKNYAAVKLGLNLKVGETLDLAELLGKDGESK